MKVSFLPSNNMDENIYTEDRSNVHVSELVFSKFKKFHQNSMLEKRHIEDIPLKNVSGPILNFHSEFVSPKFKIDEADIENKQLFANSSLQKRKLEKIEKDKNELQNTISPKFPKISDSSYLKEENYWEQYATLKAFSIKSYSSLLPSMHHKNNLSPESLSFSTPVSAVGHSEHIDQGKEKASQIEEIFTNAADIISNTEMLASQKFIQSVFQDETLPKTDSNIDHSSVRNKQFIKLPVLKNSRITSYPTRNHKDDEITTEEIDSRSVKNNYELGVNHDMDSLSFSTAAGKTVDVSDAAMKAALNLLQGAFENEDEVMTSMSVTYNTCRKKSAMKDIGCPPKKSLIEDDDTMDKTLLEKFFQNDVFSDDKELQGSSESFKDKDFDKLLESKTNNDPTTRKVRKSLGGRRSMRFYSHK